MKEISLTEILAVIAAAGLAYSYFQAKKASSAARQLIMEQRNREANEIHKQAQELRDGLVNKKEEYEKAKLKVFAVHDGDTATDGSDDES
jgi:cellobiose-specific phosphotransferase system component IIA